MMKIRPVGPLSRLGVRLRERRSRASAGYSPALTETDEENIREFQDLVSRIIGLLQRENHALEQGDVSLVAGLYEVKRGLLKSLELKEPVVEPFLKEKMPEIEVLKDSLRELGQVLRDNGRLLEGMASASRSIMTEVDRVRRRQGLEGMYDSNGQLRSDVHSPKARYEKKI